MLSHGCCESVQDCPLSTNTARQGQLASGKQKGSKLRVLKLALEMEFRVVEVILKQKGPHFDSTCRQPNLWTP